MLIKSRLLQKPDALKQPLNDGRGVGGDVPRRVSKPQPRREVRVLGCSQPKFSRGVMCRASRDSQCTIHT